MNFLSFEVFHDHKSPCKTSFFCPLSSMHSTPQCSYLKNENANQVVLAEWNSTPILTQGMSFPSLSCRYRSAHYLEDAP